MTSEEALKELKENAHQICEWELFRLKIIEKDLKRLEIYEKFIIPNLKSLILKLYNNEELTREEHEIIFEIMNLKNKDLENEHENI